MQVDLAVKLYPGIVAAPLLLGTLAGCGGRLLADTLLHSWGALPGHAELSSPGFVSRSAAMAATTYYLLAYVLQLLPASAAAGFVVTWLVRFKTMRSARLCMQNHATSMLLWTDGGQQQRILFV